MPSFNKVILIGNMTSNPELRQTQSGESVTQFSIAVNRRFGKNNECDFITIVAWKERAEFVCRYFKKGSAICVTGSIQNRSWKDKDGNNRHATEIIADEAFFVDGKTDAQGDNNAQTSPTGFSAPSYQSATPPKFEEIKNDDDLPF